MINSLILRAKEIGNEAVSGDLNALLTRWSDLLLVACVAVMVGMMIIPLPTLLLDVFLTVNITVAVTILMVSIYISQGTQIAAFPTLLLITTLYRLSLDISATRLILLKADAGEVIRAFGMFVVGGNFVVGAVIFLIITLVQFIVITKGAERVAEVSARFTLDAMPGKQMSIDADMRAGTIDFEEARRRRQALSRESQFYGAMDGAMKFVKGDAIASIIITIVNIVGGLVIGVAMNGLSFTDAIQTYSILTIGNGLISQIPALLISISAGMLVTRVASEDEQSNLGSDISRQILAQPKAIGIVSGILLLMALIPGLPKIPFFLLAAVTGGISYGLFGSIRRKAEMEDDAAASRKPSAEPEVTLTVPVVIEVSPQLAPFVDLKTEQGQAFYEQLTALRNSLYAQLGVLFPPIRVSATLQSNEGGHVVWLSEVPLVNGRIRTDAVMVNTSARSLSLYGVRAEDTQNPATGKPAAWVSRESRAQAEIGGAQIWDTHEVLLLHLSGFLRKHAKDFIGPQEVQWMLDTIKRYYPALVEEVVPALVPLQQLTDILQRLAEEEVSIRDLKTILQSLGDSARTEHETAKLTEQVRAAIRRKICYQLTEGKPLLFVYQLDPEIEDIFRNSIRQSGSGPYLAMDPDHIQAIMEASYSQLGNLPATAQHPVIIVDSDIRRFVKRLLEHNFPDVQAISYEEITPEINIQPLGVIALAETPQLDDAGAVMA